MYTKYVHRFIGNDLGVPKLQHPQVRNNLKTLYSNTQMEKSIPHKIVSIPLCTRPEDIFWKNTQSRLLWYIVAYFIPQREKDKISPRTNQHCTWNCPMHVDMHIRILRVHTSIFIPSITTHLHGIFVSPKSKVSK